MMDTIEPQNEKNQPNRERRETAFVPLFNVYKGVQTVLSVAIVVATLFTLWTPTNLLTGEVINSMLVAVEEANQPSQESSTEIQPTSITSSERIGIVAGHWKDTQNSGYVCSDGYAENQINLQIATLVVQGLSEKGYIVDLLEEFDTRLAQYKALTVISIHNDTCEFIGNEGTGFKIAPALANAYPDVSNRLTQCMINQYGSVTGLQFQTNKLTTDMTTYHSFNEVHSSTPVIVIETGYLNLDRQILSQSTDLIVRGIMDGILCFLGENTTDQEAIPAP